jgi:hypothetical protein
MADQKTNRKPARTGEPAKSGVGNSGNAATQDVERDPPFRAPVGEVVSRMADVVTLQHTGTDRRGSRYVRNQAGGICAVVQLPPTFEPKQYIQIAFIFDSVEKGNRSC